MKEGALTTLNFPRPSAYATYDHSRSAIVKREKHSVLQAQLPEPQPLKF